MKKHRLRCRTFTERHCTRLVAGFTDPPSCPRWPWPAWHAAPDAGGAGDPVMRLLEQRPAARQQHPATAAPPAGRRRQVLLGQVRSTASDLVVSAMNFIGVRYRRGGNAAEGFDCSGFTRHVFENSIGLVLPRRAEEQAKAPGLLKINASTCAPAIWCSSTPARHLLACRHLHR
jgi:hypothetical protein